MIAKLGEHKWLVPDKDALSRQEQIDQLIGPDGPAILKNAGVSNLLEFGRMVHAEMAAISDAARRGFAVQGATLYSTTFPCHVCARHIIAAGIKRVVYIEPYPKSRARDLHEDALVIDSPTLVPGKVTFQAFSGVAPMRYGGMFAMHRRKLTSGDAVEAAATVENKRFSPMPGHYLVAELKAADVVARHLQKARG